MNINNSPVQAASVPDLYNNDLYRSDLQQSQETQAAQPAARAAAAGASAGGTSAGAASSAVSSSDDVHLSELVRSLRSLASDSPERQNQIEQLARSYANGSYQVDPQATAQGIISETTKH